MVGLHFCGVQGEIGPALSLAFIGSACRHMFTYRQTDECVNPSTFSGSQIRTFASAFVSRHLNSITFAVQFSGSAPRTTSMCPLIDIRTQAWSSGSAHQSSIKDIPHVA